MWTKKNLKNNNKKQTNKLNNGLSIKSNELTAMNKILNEKIKFRLIDETAVSLLNEEKDSN